MCARLGVHQAFSQDYRPQANGRAESAGQQLQSQLRKLNAERGINWVEALPRALRHIHDRPGLGGLSPYRILMGRDRPLEGIPRQAPRPCQEAHEFFDQLEELDLWVRDTLEQEHGAKEEAHNRGIWGRPIFEVGDTVWHIKPDQ